MPTYIEELEEKLLRQEDPLQQLYLIDKMTTFYAYTDISRAQELLLKQADILEGQKKYTDYKINYLFTKATVENQRFDYDAAEKSFEELQQLLDHVGNFNQQAEAFIDYAGTCMNMQRLEDAGQYLDRASVILAKYPDDHLSARQLSREGALYLQFDDYARAIELLLSAQRKFEALGSELTLKDQYFLTLTYSGLGNIYEKNEEPGKASEAYLKVVEMCEHLQMTSRLSLHYLNLGNAYMALQDSSQAVNYYLKAIDADDSHPMAKAGGYGSLGYLYLEEERYEEALDLFEEAEELYNEVSVEQYSYFAVLKLWTARVYFETGNNDKAYENYMLALDFAEQLGDYQQLATISKDIAYFFAEAEKYKQAYEYQLMHDEYLNLHLEQLDKRRKTEIEVKYEAAERRQEADRLKLEATRLRLKALRAQMNPHFMYNALNAIQNFITSNETQTAARFLAKFAKLMRQSLDYSEEEIISLEKEIEFLSNYLYINQKLRFEGRFEYQLVIDDELEEDIVGVPAMIIQPFVENAVEHGIRTVQNGKVKVVFTYIDDDHLLCVVEDNGIGIKAAKALQEQDVRYANHKSKGTSITQQRLKILQQYHASKIDVKTIDLYHEDGIAAGTRIEIHLPMFELQLR